MWTRSHEAFFHEIDHRWILCELKLRTSVLIHFSKLSWSHLLHDSPPLELISFLCTTLWTHYMYFSCNLYHIISSQQPSPFPKKKTFSLTLIKAEVHNLFFTTNTPQHNPTVKVTRGCYIDKISHAIPTIPGLSSNLLFSHKSA